MKKVKSVVLLLCCNLFLLSGCDTTYLVKTNSAKDLRSDVMGISSAVKKVDVSFTRPILKINVYFSDNPKDETITEVLEKVKLFTTADTISEISPTVKWSGDMTVHLSIYTNNKKETPSYTYSTSYYKTADHTDNSPDNIIDYKIWTAYQ